MLNSLLKLDGSLRDIYINNTSKKDWQLFLKFVQDHYSWTFFVDNIEEKRLPRFERLIELAEEKTLLFVVKLAPGFKIHCHFFCTQKEYSEIEMDFDPNEIVSQQELNLLITFLKELSILLQKTINVCGENTPENVLFAIYPSD